MSPPDGSCDHDDCGPLHTLHMVAVHHTHCDHVRDCDHDMEHVECDNVQSEASKVRRNG